MRTVWGDSYFPPASVMGGVREVANSLGRGVAGDDLFLLALAGLQGSPPARRALEAEGLGADRLLGEVRVSADGPPGPSFVFPPAFYTLCGRAEGFAAAAGEARITPEHVLAALLWDPMSQSSQLLWRLGVPRERVVDRLHELGAFVPAAPFPPQVEVEMGEQVWFRRDQAAAVIRLLGQRLGGAVRCGFNYEGEGAWAFAEAHVDLQALVDEALAGAEPGDGG